MRPFDPMAFSGRIESWVARVGLLLSVIVVLGGCSSQRHLMPTPDVYALGIEQPFSDSLPTALKTADASLVYVTDRVAQTREDGRLDYSLARNHSVVIGEAVVDIGGDASWAELEADARTGVRPKALDLEITSVTERTRGPKDSMLYYRADGSFAATEEARRQYEAMTSEMHGMLRERLAISPRKEVLVFVHGVANSFDDALYTTAELWHYLGREFVPIAYSWPAGHGGLLRGYTYDRESSEFTVFHFKRFLDWLAGLPEVEGIHIIAHSRGTDVVATGLRELTIEARAKGELTDDPFKLRTVVIAAPDINIEVALQRTKREGTLWVADSWTMYTSPRDKAIGISEWLFGGLRIGRAQYENMDEKIKPWLDNRPPGETDTRDSVIQYMGRVGGTAGHDYFRTNPAVASDLVLSVRYGHLAGTEHGRPLEYVGGIFWKIDDDYLKSSRQ